VEVPLESYEKAVVATLAALRVRGYEAGRIVNFWSDNGRHNGLNITLVDRAGSRMEVQFPTKLTGIIGKETHLYYETLRLSKFPVQLRVDAFLRMLAINERFEVARNLPQELRQLGSPAPVDSGLLHWLAKEPSVRNNYEKWLRERGLSWRDMFERHHLPTEGSNWPGDWSGTNE
jgi:hypothetical protein